MSFFEMHCLASQIHCIPISEKPNKFQKTKNYKGNRFVLLIKKEIALPQLHKNIFHVLTIKFFLNLNMTHV